MLLVLGTALGKGGEFDLADQERHMATPDFEELRRKRRDVYEKCIQDICTKWGLGIEALRSQVLSNESCYCGCPEGPCEHLFQGWREFSDGNGGEQFCERCGLGAMAHVLHMGL